MKFKFSLIIILITFIGNAQTDSLTASANYNTIFKLNFDDVPKKVFKKYKITEDKFEDSKTITGDRGGMRGVRIHPKLTYKNGILTPVIFFHYSGSSWIFMDEIFMKSAEQTIKISLTNQNRRVYGTKVYESSMIVMDDEIMSFLSQFKTGKEKLEIRYSGSKGNKDINLYNSEVGLIKKTIDLYNVLLEYSQ